MPTLAGTIERIVFRNEETHFTVARLRPNDTGRLFRDELITMVGALPGINVGELLEVTGEWETHPQHGRDLRVISFTSHAPVSPTGLKRYLGSGVIKGIGPKTAERIVETFRRADASHHRAGAGAPDRGDRHQCRQARPASSPAGPSSTRSAT